MNCCLDVDYRASGAVAAAVLFEDWSQAEPTDEVAVCVPTVEPYQPGSFYLRELPCLVAVLQRCPSDLGVIVVDGYVWLSDGKPGLGAHLWEALGQKTPVVGVAKNSWKGHRESTELNSKSAVPILRGASQKSLWVTSAGVDLQGAAQLVRAMAGSYRIPALLKAVDALCRAKT